MPSEQDLLAARRRGGEEVAQKRFATATRSANFSMSLGVREVRMLQARDFRGVHFWSREELNTLQRLIDKGLWPTKTARVQGYRRLGI